MPWITKEGRTVEEAQDAAVAASGMPATDLEIEVVNEGAKGLFGLGGEPAVVRVRPRDEATDFRHAFRDDITPGDDADREQRRTPPSVADDDADAEEDSVFADEAALGTDDIDEDAAPKRPLSEQQEEAARVGTEIVKGIIERMDLAGDVNTRVAGGTVYIEVFGDEMGILIGRGGTTLEALQELVRAGVQRRLKTRQAIVVDVEAYWERRRKPRDEARERGPRRGGGRRRGGRGGRGGQGGRSNPSEG